MPAQAGDPNDTWDRLVPPVLPLSDDRLLDASLTGPGGTGKTRLALAMAERLQAAFPDGLFFIPLAPIRDPALVAATIAQQIGVREEAGLALTEQIATRLTGKRALLVLDNFEHLLAVAPLVAELLARAAVVKVLATSREPLHLRGEREFAVLPLALPGPQQAPDLDELAQNAAVHLFVARARDVSD